MLNMTLACILITQPLN